MDSKIVVFPSPFINILSSQRYRDTDTRHFQILLKPQSDEVGWHSNLTVWICRRRNQNNCRTYHTKQAIGPRQVSSCNVNIFHQLFLFYVCTSHNRAHLFFSLLCVWRQAEQFNCAPDGMDIGRPAASDVAGAPIQLEEEEEEGDSWRNSQGHAVDWVGLGPVRLIAFKLIE